MTLKAVWSNPRFQARFGIDLFEAPIVNIGLTAYTPIHIYVSCMWGPGLSEFTQRWTLSARKVLSPERVDSRITKLNAEDLPVVPPWMAELLARAQPHGPGSAWS